MVLQGRGAAAEVEPVREEVVVEAPRQLRALLRPPPRRAELGARRAEPRERELPLVEVRRARDRRVVRHPVLFLLLFFIFFFFTIFLIYLLLNDSSYFYYFFLDFFKKTSMTSIIYYYFF